MSSICEKCGLPKDICACDVIAKEKQTITIKHVERSFGKIMTLIEGIDTKGVDMKDLTKKLKQKFACGGTFKDGRIELQGKHTNKVKEELIKLGFSADTIEVL
ncbi:MAG: translation initiation factor [Candidatus Nanoarchaeia archaeon]|nr:translation initiation factor [Candidatus Nanoarchaeia archaeon]